MTDVGRWSNEIQRGPGFFARLSGCRRLALASLMRLSSKSRTPDFIELCQVEQSILRYNSFNKQIFYEIQTKIDNYYQRKRVTFWNSEQE